MENARAQLTERTRIFEEIGVGNFVAQPRVERFPPVDQNSPPRTERWRSNLSALSQKHNLYFHASVDRIHIIVPRDLRQTLPGIPDLVLALPRTPAGIDIGGYIDESIPHCVNHIKVGNLGSLEVILIACDDGDVLAYYTHLFPEEIRRQDSQLQAPISSIVPFFHENVGSSTWGLALHAQSRLIAVSSNRREVTIFAHGYTTFRDPGGEESPVFKLKGSIRYLELQASAGNQMFTQFVDGDIARYRQFNYRMTLPLGEQGHNVPSVDFASGPDGNASHVLATDINGNLWIFNLSTGDKQCKPRVHTSLDRENVMGWGVVCLPLKYFKFAKTPQEALGLPYLFRSFGVAPLRDPQCFNITCTSKDVRENSPYHPIYGYGIDGQATTPESDQEQRLASIPSLEPYNDSDAPDYKSDVLEYESDKSKSIEQAKVKEKVRVQHVPRWAIRTREPEDIRTLEFLLSLPPAKRPYSWQEIKQREAGSYVETPSDSSIANASTEAQADQAEFDIRLPAGHAILRTYNQDIELLPPDYPNTLRTFFRGIVRQELGNLRDQLRHFDRLNMLAVIPELSLVVATSQIGRAALITLTRLKDSFASTGPVVMFRLDLILPLKMHEDEQRPNVPLAGMAVSPLQTGESVGKEGWAGKRWRLLLHYVDQTILSYELFRNEEDELTVL